MSLQQNTTTTQAPYITLAQSTVSAGMFRPVSVDAAGRAKNLPISLRQHTIEAMSAACKQYAAKYDMQVLFDKMIIHQEPPAHVKEQLQALVIDTVRSQTESDLMDADLADLRNGRMQPIVRMTPEQLEEIEFGRVGAE